jgi:hypothetical protein
MAAMENGATQHPLVCAISSLATVATATTHIASQPFSFARTEGEERARNAHLNAHHTNSRIPRLRLKCTFN